MKDTIYWIWLAEQSGYASENFTKLYNFYKDPVDVYNLENYEIMQLDKVISSHYKDKLCQKNLEKASAIYEYCCAHGITVLSYADERYPESLKLLPNPPIVLYCLGNIPNFNDNLCLGIVGTRKMSRYGREAAYRFGYELSSLGVNVVSGLALGIDAMATCGAIDGGTPTIQVLGCGVSVIYPKVHAKLREKVIEQGVIISEYPPLEQAQRFYFPQRNRIISGISQGVFVAECRKASGAMITAADGFVQGKYLFAYPGKVGDPTAEGPNELLRNGAFAALTTEDIIRNYGLYFNEANKKETKNKLEAARERAIDAAKSLAKYSIPDKCEENEKINNAPILGAPTGKSKEKNPSISKAKSYCEEAPKNEPKNEVVSAPIKTAKDYGLDDKMAKVFDSIDCKKPMSVDKIICEGLTAQDVITALTMLEINGLISSLPGGLYIRK